MSKGFIPASHEWCSDCVVLRGKTAGLKSVPQPCRFHPVGADGKPSEYSGPDLYEPSDWVLSVVGKLYNTITGVCLCFGYDPRHGFWMRDEKTGEERNVSERAIGRTCHRIWGKA